MTQFGMFKSIFVYLLVSTSANINQRLCDLSASMDKGCHLHDYDGQWRTHKCADSKVLWVGQCFDACASGFYPYGAECLSCSNKCKRCSGVEPYDCLECESGFKLDFRNVCIIDCDIEGMYGNTNFNCLNCNSQCLNCFQGYDTTCIECREGSNLSMFEYSKG